MLVTASITGVFKMILMLIGAFVLLRFLGQLLQAKRNMEEERRLLKKQREAERERSWKLKHFGKTSVMNKTKSPSTSTEDVDFEEV